MPSRYRLFAILSRVHRFLYVLFNGRFLSRRGNARFLLLTTRGRRSSRDRTVALLYVPHPENQESPAVIASHGGNPKAPDWLLNIREDPKVRVRAGTDRWEGVARIAGDDERLELWNRFVEIFPGYEGYQAHTTRIFPIVIITRT